LTALPSQTTQFGSISGPLRFAHGSPKVKQGFNFVLALARQLIRQPRSDRRTAQLCDGGSQLTIACTSCGAHFGGS
jgi:hypothetical protein